MTAGSRIREVLDRLAAEGLLPTIRRCRGLSEQKLVQLEELNGRPLPADYREFLSIAGRTSNARLLAGSYFFWPAPLEFADEVENTFDFVPPLSSDWTVIMIHQGYVLYWLEGADADAPVFRWTDEPDGRPERVFDSFADFLLEAGSVS